MLKILIEFVNVSKFNELESQYLEVLVSFSGGWVHKPAQ
jgi:hypothetical protein